MLLNQLQRASFRGVPFLVPHDKTEEGRHVVAHEYPDSNQRYAEDNGRDTPKFTLSAIVANPDLPGKLRNLRRALSAEGPGTLRHPWCGVQFVQVDTYTITRADKHGGYVEIEIKFLVTGPPQFPALVSGIPAVVSSLASSAIVDIFSAFVAEFGDPRIFGAVPGSAATSVPGFINALSAGSLAVLTDEVATLLPALEPLAPATAAVGQFIADHGRYAVSPEAFAATLTTILRAPLAGNEVSNRQLVSAYANLGEAAEAIAVRGSAIVPTTLDLGNRQVALSILSGHVQAAAFVNLAEAVAVSTYDTADDVERAENLLTNHRELLQERDLSTTVRAALTDIYVAASEVLRDAAVRLPRIVSVLASNTPASVLAYMLYEDRLEAQTETIVEQRAAMLIKLNINETPLVLPGEVLAVMQEA